VTIPVQITFRDIEPSEAIEAKIRERAAKLERFHSRILRCQVVVEQLQRHRAKGDLFNVNVELSVPGAEPIVANRTPTDRVSHEDVYVAIRDAFDAAVRQVEGTLRRQRGDVKTHEIPPHGRIVRLAPLDGYGFLETPDGLEVYFHENAVVSGKLSDLTVGSEVRFAMVPKEGVKGPQASSVQPVGKHHVGP